MASNTAGPTPFDIGGLPTEMQLQIFDFVVSEEDHVIMTRQHSSASLKSKHEFSFVSSGPQYRAFVGSKSTRGAYLDALGDYMVKNAGDVDANVEDFKFTNLRAFIKAVFRANKLQHFLHPTGNGSELYRRLHVSHITTDKLPDTFENPLKFVKFLASFMKKLPGPPAYDVRMLHRVRECGNEAKVVQLLNTLSVGVATESIPERVFAAFRQHHLFSSWQATNASQLERMLWERMRDDIANERLISGGGLDEDDMADQVPANGDLEQAVGGAEVSEDDEDMETGHLSGNGADEYTSTHNGGTDSAMVEEMNEETNEEMQEDMDQESDEVNIKEEDEEEPPGVLYDHDQHQMSSNYPPPATFSAFLGQAMSGHALVPIYPRFTANY